jgi:hypothetical protein
MARKAGYAKVQTRGKPGTYPNRSVEIVCEHYGWSVPDDMDAMERRLRRMTKHTPIYAQGMKFQLALSHAIFVDNISNEDDIARIEVLSRL